MSDAEGRLDDARMYASLRERRGDGYEDAQDEAARERQEAIDEKARGLMVRTVRPGFICCACDEFVGDADAREHPLNCETAQAMAAQEVDRG